MIELVLTTRGIKTSVSGERAGVKYKKEANSIYSITFKVYNTEAAFSNIFPKITNVKFYDTTSAESLIFEGTVFDKNDRMDSDGKSYCEVTAVHILDELHSTSVVCFRMWSPNASTTGGLTAKYAINKLINYHNSSSDSSQQIGVIWEGLLSTFEGTSVDYIDSATTFDAIMSNINYNGWQFKPKYQDGAWNIAIAKDYGKISDQHVIIGVNMIDCSRKLDASEIVTRIIPVGAEGYVPFAKLNPSMDELALIVGIGDQSWAKTGRVTLYGYRKPDDQYPYPKDVQNYLVNEELEKKYPPVYRVVEYSDVTCEIADDPVAESSDTGVYKSAQEKLYNLAKADTDGLTDMVEQYETTAADLSKAGYDFKEFEVYDICHIVNNTLEINTWMQVIGIEIDYTKPGLSKLTFGNIEGGFAKQLARANKSTNEKIAGNAHKANETLSNRTGGLNIQRMDDTAYEALTTKNGNTLYTVDDSTDQTKATLYLGTKKISGGGGATVENAAVLIPTNFHDYVINEQLIVDIQPPNMVYYGNMPAFSIVQGHYCIMTNTQSTSGRWTGYNQDLFDAIIANKDKFGVQYGTEISGGWLDKVGNNGYPTNYVYVKTDIKQVVTNASGYRTRINFSKYYAANDAIPSGSNWWETTMTHSNSFTPYQSTDIDLLAPSGNYFSNPLHSYFVVPVITNYTQDNLTTDPFGEVTIGGWLIFATDDGTNYGAYMLVTNSSLYLRGSVPLISDAEKAFMLGISQRTEPTTSN